MSECVTLRSRLTKKVEATSAPELKAKNTSRVTTRVKGDTQIQPRVKMTSRPAGALQ